MNADRLTPKLLNTLEGMAFRYAGGNRHVADDIFSEMLEAIAHMDDEETRQRILTKARWVALSHLKAERIYAHYVGTECEAAVTEPDDERDEEPEDADCVFADRFDVEHYDEQLELAASIELVIDTLEVTDQKIVRLLKDGFQPAEIARKLDVSRSAVSQRMTRIALTFAAAGFAPASL